jgi:hypothetical protein
VTGPFAGSNPALGTTNLTPEDYATAREKYRPDKIRILFVAESPPSSGGYFYFPNTIGKDHLFRETMKALKLWPTRKAMSKGVDKRPLLEEFRSRGFFLIDTCEVPVDKLPAGQRHEAINRDAPGLAARAQALHPDHIIIVKKTVYLPIRDALQRAGLKQGILNKQPISFPSHGNQRNYRSAVRRLLGNRQEMSE